MNATLVLCTRCAQLLGCADPEEKSCAGCRTHDCPLLPAPLLSRGLCPRCGAAARARVWAARPETGAAKAY